MPEDKIVPPSVTVDPSPTFTNALPKQNEGDHLVLVSQRYLPGERPTSAQRQSSDPRETDTPLVRVNWKNSPPLEVWPARPSDNGLLQERAPEGLSSNLLAFHSSRHPPLCASSHQLPSICQSPTAESSQQPKETRHVWYKRMRLTPSQSVSATYHLVLHTSFPHLSPDQTTRFPPHHGF